MKKPAKTREELESAIRLEMDDICERPTGLAISVAPHKDSWKVVIMTDGLGWQAGSGRAAELVANLRCTSIWLASVGGLKQFNIKNDGTAG